MRLKCIEASLITKNMLAIHSKTVVVQLFINDNLLLPSLHAIVCTLYT